MADPGFINIDGKPYPLIAETQLLSGKRAISRGNFRPSQPSDPSRIGQAEWILSGPLGVSRESQSGYLGHDYSDNIDALYEDLLTASPKGFDIDLGGDEPESSAPAYYGVPKYGAAKYHGGTALASPGNAEHADFQQGYLFVHRGAYSSQINSSWSLVETVIHGGTVHGAANWKGYGWVGLGAGAPLQKRTAVSSTGSTYTEVHDENDDEVYAGYLKRGNDRIWWVDAEEGYKARYSFDDFQVLSNPFEGGDDRRTLTGIGTLGPLTIFGALDGVFGFTDAGKAVVIKDLEDRESLLNGSKMTEQWGWIYFITDGGLRCWAPNTSNPVGPEAYKGFEGPIDGKPTEVWAVDESLFCTYLTTSGDSYILRGEFGPSTADTGMPLWYPFKKLASTESYLLYSTGTSFDTNPNLIVGNGTNITRYVLGRRGRDIADSNYVFSTEGGSWYGTTMMRAQHLRKNVRYAMIQTENCSATKSWQLAVSCDGGAYVNVGSAVTSNGRQILRPVSGSTPLTTVDFNTLKPRLTQVNDSTTTPPQIRGKLVIVYDERPDMIEEVTVVLSTEQISRTRLDELVNSTKDSPVQISLPGDRTTYYGFVTSVSSNKDIKGDSVGSVQLGLSLWDIS